MYIILLYCEYVRENLFQWKLRFLAVTFVSLPSLHQSQVSELYYVANNTKSKFNLHPKSKNWIWMLLS